MTRTRFFALAVLTILVIGAAGCGESPAVTDTAPAAATPPAASTDTVAFEPAYPEEVSTEQLSAEDKAQQETHQHGDGEEHPHDETTTTEHGHPH